jgi:hypothetical protein
MANRTFALTAAIGGGLLLAGCTAIPTYPLLTPIQVAKNFGYFEQPIDDTHWVVSYVTPEQPGYGFRFDRSPAEAQAKTLAFDLALWHASQIAEAKGYAGFAVTDRRSSTDAVNISDVSADPYWYGGYGFHNRRFFGRFGWGGDWDGQLGPSPESTLQVEAKLTIALTKTPNGDDFKTAETINRLRAAYPGAESSPVQPPNKPAP